METQKSYKKHIKIVKNAHNSHTSIYSICKKITIEIKESLFIGEEKIRQYFTFVQIA